MMHRNKEKKMLILGLSQIGMLESLVSYFCSLKKNFYSIAYTRQASNFVVVERLYLNGELANEISHKIFGGLLVNYLIKKFIWIYYLILLTTIAPILLRKRSEINASYGISIFSATLVQVILGRFSWTVYYCMDLFSRPIKRGISANLIWRIYVMLEKYVVNSCNEIWDLTKDIGIARKSNLGLDPVKTKPYSVVGMSYPDYHLEFLSKEVNPGSIIFVGSLSENQGLDILIDAVAEIVNRRVGITVSIYGDGPYRGSLEARIKLKKVGEHVRLHGFVQSERELYGAISRGNLAWAVYKQGAGFNSNYAQGKPFLYLSLGIPIIVSSFMAIAEKVRNEELGVVVTPEVDDVVEAILLSFDENFIQKIKPKIQNGIHQFLSSSVFPELKMQ